MIKWNTIQNIINTCGIICLYFWMLFTNGELPQIKQQVNTLDQKVEIIDYYIQHNSKSDTISVVINYVQQPSNKK